MEPAKSAPLGPRLPGRLTADLISHSAQFMNCVGEYQLDLRANKIPVIENLGVTQNQFDVIDLSDNMIVILEGFPKLPRLGTLFVNNNRVMRIARHLEASIPNLHTLILTNNKLKKLQDLDPLCTLPKLRQLSLVDNEVTKVPNYRLYLVHKLKKLKVLDYQKIKQQERQQAERLFGAPAANGELHTFEPGEGRPEVEAPAPAAPAPVPVPQEPKTLSQEQVVRIKAAIAGAATFEEIQRLEYALNNGHMPSELGNGSLTPPEPMEED